MAYIPLDEDLKVKGKAAVDGVGGRLGKSGGAIIQQALLILIVGSTQLTIAPYLGFILLITVLAWMGSVFGLSKEFNRLTGSQEKSE
jgi:AAA family ATP:ADP antiporter